MPEARFRDVRSRGIPVAPNQLKKKLNRALLVSWREQPTRHDVAALQANIRRVGLVVRVRWALLSILIIYSVIAGALYAQAMPITDLVRLMIVPAFTLGFVVLYSAYYARNYRRLGSIAVWNNLQLALDALVVTVLVHFSGGVNSWFWTVYALIIFEAAFILPRSRDVWFHALFSLGLLGAVELAEMAGVLSHAVIPFAAGNAYKDSVFVLVRYFWQAAVLLGSAWVAIMLVGEFRNELDSQQAHSLVDQESGLFSRDYFMRALRIELRRAQRDGRALHVVLIDIDRFGEFNKRFGIDAGDRLIRSFAQALIRFAGTGESDQATTNVAARLGGEEFAVLVTESAPTGSVPSREEAVQAARSLAEQLARISVNGAGASVSVGVSSMPEDGATCHELFDAADTALSAAIAAGGNRALSASECAGAPHKDYDEDEV